MEGVRVEQVQVLRRFLDGRWADVRDEVRKVIADPLFHPTHGLSVDEQRARTFEQATQLASTRGPRLGYPRRYGGEADVGAGVTAFETLAFADLSLLVKAGVQWGLFGGALLHLGTKRHHDAYLTKMMSLEIPGCFAMTETGHGSDVQSVRTTATYDPSDDTFVINTPDEDARKDYIGNAARDGRMAVVFAQLITGEEEHGVHAFVVPLRDDNGVLSGIRIEDCGHKAGLNGVDNGRIYFDDVKVPRDALLDKHGTVYEDGRYESSIENRTRRFFTMVGTLVQGRVSVSGAAVSATKTALTIAVRYGDVRRQFSPPGRDEEVVLLDYRQHQRRLMPLLAKTYAMHFAQEELVAQLHDGFTQADYPERERRVLESNAAGIKAFSTWHATQTIQMCREACGGAGYLAESRLPGLKADTDVFTTFEGDNTVLMQLVAKGLLTNYRDEFGELDTLGTIRFIADQVVGQVVERTTPARQLIQALIDAVPGGDDDPDLRERGWHLELFEWREEHVLEGVARRIRGGVKAGNDPFEVFNACQDHVLLAAHAHVDRVILEAFVAAIDRCDDPDVKEVLSEICDLFALWVIEENKGWFMEHGRLSATRSKAIIAEVNGLCSSLRPRAVALVDAFGVPEELLPPIATGAEAARQDAKKSDDSETGLPGFAPPPP